VCCYYSRETLTTWPAVSEALQYMRDSSHILYGVVHTIRHSMICKHSSLPRALKSIGLVCIDLYMQNLVKGQSFSLFFHLSFSLSFSLPLSFTLSLSLSLCPNRSSIHRLSSPSFIPLFFPVSACFLLHIFPDHLHRYRPQWTGCKV